MPALFPCYTPNSTNTLKIIRLEETLYQVLSHIMAKVFLCRRLHPLLPHGVRYLPLRDLFWLHTRFVFASFS